MHFAEDASQVFAELDRLDRLPEVGSQRLDAALEVMFQATQADVPVDSGHLRATGDSSSRVIGETWTGTISYGQPGDAEWAKEPASSYALFVLEHDDYMRATRDPALTSAFQDAIGDMLRGTS